MGSCVSSENTSAETMQQPWGKEVDIETAEFLARESRIDEQLACLQGRMCTNGASTIASMHTQQGKKGPNQDSMILWENFGSREDTVFLGVFDGHGPYGHIVGRRVRDSLPSMLLNQWHELLSDRTILTLLSDSSMASPVKENLNPIPSSSSLKLYSFWRSSCAWRVRIALNLKGLPYEYKAVNLRAGEQFSEDYTELNPIQLVPTLVDGNITVADSLAILLYLEDKYPEHSLLPDDLQLKATCMQVTAIIGSNIQPFHLTNRTRGKLGPEEQIAWIKYFIERGFFALETLLKNVSGKYCIGDQLTLADVFLAPQVCSAAKRFDVDVSKFPTLNKINQALAELPEFQAAVPEKTPDYIS